MPSADTIAAQPHFLSHLKALRLSEELAVVQKTVKEYEDLFTTLYQNACEHCKQRFQRIGVGGAQGAVSKSTVVTAPASSVCHLSSSSTQPVGCPIVKDPRYSLPGPPTGQGPNIIGIIRTQAAKPGGNGASFHGASTKRTFRGRSGPKVSASALEEKYTQAHFFVKLPDGPVGRPTLQVKLERVWVHGIKILSVKFSPDGKYLAVGVPECSTGSPRTYVYDMGVGRQVCLLADRYAGPRYHSGKYLSFSGDGTYLATGHSTGQTMIWEFGKRRVRNTFGARPLWANNSIDFSPDGRSVVSGSFHSLSVPIWSLRDGSATHLCDHDVGHGKVFASAAVKFSPDGKLVVASDFDGILRLWNVRTSRLVRKWQAHEDTVWSLAFTPDGRGLVTAGDQTLKYWNLLGEPPFGFGDSMEVKVLNSGHTKDFRSVAISPDGRWVVSGASDGAIHIWDVADGSLHCTLLGHEKGVLSVDFSSTGRYVVCGSLDGKVSVWRCK